MFEIKPQFVTEKCLFCCIPLRTGCLILAYLVLVCSIVNIYFDAVPLYGTFMTRDSIPVMDNLVVLTFSIIGCIEVVLGTLVVLFNTVLLIGLHKENSKFVKIFLKFLVVITVWTLFKLIAEQFLLLADLAGLAGRLTLFYLIFNVYYIFVLRSHYFNMMENTKYLPANEKQHP